MKLKRRKYFVTLKFKDVKSDRESNINRDGVYRLSIGLPVQKYEAIFGLRPSRPNKGSIIKGNYDFFYRDRHFNLSFYIRLDGVDCDFKFLLH